MLMFALVFIALSGVNTFGGPAQIIIVNINAPGVGFNDPTPAAPVGGNAGTAKRRCSKRCGKVSLSLVRLLV